jgi:isocitrate dehydrogenase
MKKWINPYIDTSKWEYFDLSCVARDNTEDKCLHDAVASGAKLKAIFKEPTVTPTEKQKKLLGLKKTWGSPNGAMRKGWNGITISRDTIHIDGMELGFKKPVLFERHAVGGESGAGWKTVGKGRLVTKFYPNDKYGEAITVDERVLDDDHNVAVVYHNPYDNIHDLAHHFFKLGAFAQGKTQAQAHGVGHGEDV